MNVHFQFNFVGKLLGPKGNTFKRLQQNTGTKMSILGRGSMRDKEKVLLLYFVASTSITFAVHKVFCFCNKHIALPNVIPSSPQTS